MNKQVKHTYGGMNQDVSKYKFPPNIYFEGRNIRIVATDSQSTSAVTNEKGNTLKVTIPIPVINQTNITYNNKTLPYNTPELNPTMISGTQTIVGHSFIRGYIIVLTTDDNGFDCIWKIDEKTYDITLLYVRNMGFHTNNPIQVINNYENKAIDKIYWVDSVHQLRFINIYHSIDNGDLEELIDLSINSIESVGEFTFSQPQITDILSGGIHTSGMIQYAYNLFKVNGSQTRISPLSELVPLDKGDGNGGGEVNEITGTTPVIKITNLDPLYTNIKLYAIKYTSYNEQPSVSLILDSSIVGLTEITHYDDGRIINTISLEELLYLGSDIIIPKHIATKHNRMFLANYKEKNYNLDIDCRAYSFPELDFTTRIYDQVIKDEENDVLAGLELITVDSTYNVPKKHSAININYEYNKYQYNSSIYGGEGKYLKYKLVRNEVGINDFTEEDSKKRFLKDDEIYRIGLEFFNSYGQVTLPKWIADFKVYTDVLSNLNGNYASIELTFKGEFYQWLNTSSNFLDENGNYDENLKPVGYKLLRAQRGLSDRTILCQGILNSMLSQTSGDNTNSEDYPDKINKVNQGLKLPSMMRRFDTFLMPMYGVENYRRLDLPNQQHPYGGISTSYSGNNPIENDAGAEVYAAHAGGETVGTYQFTSLIQLFSPEITFNTIQQLGSVKLKVLGLVDNEINSVWNKRLRTTDLAIIDEHKIDNAISIWDSKVEDSNLSIIAGGEGNYQIGRWGFFAPDSEAHMHFNQTYRKYGDNFIKAKAEYDIYGTPVLVELGQGRALYNNDALLAYTNSLEQLSTDIGTGGNNPAHAITSINTWGAKNITLALGPNGLSPESRITLEQLYLNTGINDPGSAIIAEIVLPEEMIYLSNIYGGNSYEAKKRTNYIEVGEYQNINNSIYNCLNIGDTFISNFDFTKLVKTETELYDFRVQQVTEIVSFPVETTIDLSNRNDFSLTPWDNRFQPRYDEYHKYNRVYSQESNFIIRRDLDYKFKVVKDYDTNIIASKAKTAGEVIDSWTDLQINNVITLDGKYGPINALNNFKDEIYALQDQGIAFLSINPRVQIQGSDGIGLQLGTGNVLDSYKYITDNSGTKNKWSLVNSPEAFYYYDTLNNSLNVFKGGVGALSDIRGLHSFLHNNINYDIISKDNPIIGQGISSGYDYDNNDVFYSFLQNDKKFTISFNEGKSSYISFYDYHTSRYISKGDNLIILDNTNKSLYKQYDGNYNEFFGITYPSYITLLVNPEADLDTVFDNIKFKSEVYKNGIDQENLTLTHVRLYNEYQDSGLISLVLGRSTNLRRKFRDWNAILPRNNGTRERIRNPWVFLQLYFQNEDNLKLILHDTIVDYTI
ncbi:MAG TPA: hypothetical protein VF680_16755 [Allosphingosinicella sp.]|jgi:hypothetical protein